MRRAGVALVLLAPVFAGCFGQGPAVPEATFDTSVPHCVGECGRVVDENPTHDWEPAVAVNPANPDHIVIVRTTEPPNGFYGTYFASGRTRVSVTEDGGATWESSTIPSGLDIGPTHPLAAYPSAGYDPVLVFLQDGTLVMSAIATNNIAVPGIPLVAEPGLTLYTMRSADGGHTWGDVRIVDHGEGVLIRDTAVGEVAAGAMWKFNDKEWMALGPDGTLLLVWTQFLNMHPENGLSPEQGVRPGGRLVFSSSENGGLTWSQARIIDEEGSPSGASPVVGRDGVWRVTYVNYEEDALRFAQSRDRGETWDVRTIAAATWYPRMREQTLASGVERLLLVYAPREEDRPSERRIELTWSDDGGATWRPPIVIDTPQGNGDPEPEVVGGPGDSAWVTFFDLEGAYPWQHSRYVAVNVADGVPSELLVLDAIDVYPGESLGHYMGLASTPDGDAIAVWVTHRSGEYDLAWARVAAGTRDAAGVATPPTSGVPAGLDEPVAYEFTGHVDLPYYCTDPHPTVEQAVRDRALVRIEFDVPPDTRFVNGTLSWTTTGPTPETSDLDLYFLDAEGDGFDAGTLDVPETFSFELREGDQGLWTAEVYNCQNPPTDFTLNVELS